jgi:hypothetical protein
MIITIPSYIESAGIVGQPLKYKWSVAVSENIAEQQSARIENLVDELTFKGILTLSLGVAEWIAWRMDGLSDFKKPLLAIEGLWAAIVDPLYFCDFEPFDIGGSKGPADGPLYDMMDRLSLIFTSYIYNEASITEDVIPLAFLARHVMPDKLPFEEWFKVVLKRMTKVCPLDKNYIDPSRGTYDSSYEEPLSREILDPKVHYDGDRARKMISEFLTHLNHVNNPYLRSPQDMVKLGFQGKPYSL